MGRRIVRMLVLVVVAILTYYFGTGDEGTTTPADSSPTPAQTSTDGGSNDGNLIEQTKRSGGEKEGSKYPGEANDQADRDVPPHAYGDAAERIKDAYQRNISGFMIEVQGRVERLLSDDNEGSRHQRFILELPNRHTVLVAHNIDLAERVPLRTGDTVTLYGQFEHNDRGGVLHWTHKAYGRNHESGWIEYKGVKYH